MDSRTRVVAVVTAVAVGYCVARAATVGEIGQAVVCAVAVAAIGGVALVAVRSGSMTRALVPTLCVCLMWVVNALLMFRPRLECTLYEPAPLSLGLALAALALAPILEVRAAVVRGRDLPDTIALGLLSLAVTAVVLVAALLTVGAIYDCIPIDN